MASARTKEAALALGLALLLIGGVAATGSPSWLAWVAAGVAVVGAEVVGRWRWRDRG